jgi:PAS domain S-box-containing protein
MTIPAIGESERGRLLLGERHVLELVATGTPLSATLDALCRLIDSESGLMSSIFLLDRRRTQLSLVAGPHLPAAWIEGLQSFPATPEATACGAAVNTRERVVVVDLTTSPLYRPWIEVVRSSGIRSVWSTPFFSTDGHVLGTFAVYDREPRAPADSHLALVARATHLASIAVERHQTEEALRREERLLRLVLDAIPVGVLVLDAAGEIMLSNPASQRIWGRVIPSGPERYAKSKGWWQDTQKRVEPDEWASVRARVEGEEIINEVIEIESFDGVRKVIQNSAVPIRDEGQTILGAVVVNEDISARRAAEREVEASAKEMQALAGRLMQVQDDERRRIARMLHEATAQDLAVLKMLLARLVRTAAGLSDEDRALLSESVDLAERGMTEIRTLSYLLHPPLLDESGLLSAIRWYAQGFAQRSGIEVDLDLPATYRRLAREVETALFRVLQEALINIHRHAHSPSAGISLRIDSERLTLEIQDRGMGMTNEPAGGSPAGGVALGVGIPGMRERLKQLGGALEIRWTSDGTLVRAVLPLSGIPS